VLMRGSLSVGGLQVPGFTACSILAQLCVYRTKVRASAFCGLARLV
jgi:hypothetical protein